MHIVARARQFVESLRALLHRSEVERRRCPVCGSSRVHRHGFYTRRPYTLHGRRTVAVQRYRCQACGATHADAHPDLLPGGHYSRSVRRCAIDQWLRWVQRHTGSSLRRVAEWLRAVIGHQGRWALWYPVGDPWVRRRSGRPAR